jgi:hypothetical protein
MTHVRQGTDGCVVCLSQLLDDAGDVPAPVV